MTDYVALPPRPGRGRLWTGTSTVYRVGFPPHTFDWAPPEYASHDGRWDDPSGDSRTTYVAEGLLGALLESLRYFVADTDLPHYDEDPDYPSAAAGDLDPTWLTTRSTGRAQLHGRYLDVRDPTTIAGLRPRHLPLAREVGLPDVDAAALKGLQRRFTQAVATTVRDLPDALDGICYASRHGDHLLMWAVFEHPTGTGPRSPQLTTVQELTMTRSAPEVVEAMTMLGLQWS